MIKSAFITNFLRFYNILWQAALPFLKKNQRLQKGFHERTHTRHLAPADIWIQAASAGEAYLAVQLIHTMAPEKPLKVLITTLTQQGKEILETHLSGRTFNPNLTCSIQWFPFDIPGIMEKAAARVCPETLILLETEIWPALILALKQQGTRIEIINARMSRKSFKWYYRTRFLWKHFSPDQALAISRRDAGYYRQLFPETSVETMYNMKFETLIPDAENDAARDRTGKRIAPFFPEGRPVCILASIRKQEESMAIRIILELLDTFPDLIIAVFPRHMHRIPAWKKQLEKTPHHWRLRSGRNPAPECQVILWDTFGELKAAYDFADVVFVGASLVPLGGQNFLEAAISGAATVTGPHVDDFLWAGEEIFRQNLVTMAAAPADASAALIHALRTENPARREERKTGMQRYITDRLGGSRNAASEILKHFDH